MSEINNNIINLINKGKTLNEICNATGLTSRQLFYRLYLLKVKGYDIERKYYYNGDIKYIINKGLHKNTDKILITDKSDTKFKAIIISDLHLVNKNERIDLLNKVYEYATKNNYNIIINGGDVIDGLIGNNSHKKYIDIMKQIEYALKVYPYDKNIINYICLGNHDLNAYSSSGNNIENVFDIKRHDLVSLGYGYGKLYVKNDEITVIHPKCVKLPENIYKNGLIIEGHSHRVGYKDSGYTKVISINSLSDVIGKNPPGFMTLNSNFIKGILSNTLIESYLYINDKFVKTSEYMCDLSLGRNTSSKIINNEEMYLKKK